MCGGVERQASKVVMVDLKLIYDVEDMVGLLLRYTELYLIHREDVLGINSHAKREYTIRDIA